MSSEKLSGFNWRFGLACLLSLGMLWLSYSGYFHNSFHFDDGHVIETNAYIRSLKNVPTFFVDARTSSSLPANSSYRPLVTLTLALDYWLGGGLNPKVFHETQFALLMLQVLLMFFLYRHVMDLAERHSWNPYLALGAALLYGIHTMNTEALNIISARSEMLSTIGILGSFLLYIGRPAWRRYGLYLIPMTIGALAKPPSIMFAPLLFVYVFLFEQNAPMKMLGERLGACLKATWPAFALGIFLFVFIRRMDHPELLYATTDRWDYAISQPYMWLHYFRLFFVPVGLTADTDWRVLDHWYDTRLFAGLAFAALLALSAWKLSKKPAFRPISFGIAWFLLALLPASSIFPLAEVTNDHRAFFPYIGLTLAVVWGLIPLIENRPYVLGTLFPMVMVLAISSLGFGTYERNKVWMTEETLWYDVTLKSPQNGRALMNYGLSQMGQGKFDRAKDYFERALVFNPYYATLEINLGIVYGALHDQKTAEDHFKRALSLQPRFAEGHYFYSRWLNQQGRTDEAIQHLEQAIAISPAHMPSRELLMNLYFNLGQRDKLIRLIQDTLAVWPDDPTARAFAQKMTAK